MIPSKNLHGIESITKFVSCKLRITIRSWDCSMCICMCGLLYLIYNFCQGSGIFSLLFAISNCRGNFNMLNIHTGPTHYPKINGKLFFPFFLPGFYHFTFLVTIDSISYFIPFTISFHLLFHSIFICKNP